MNRTENSGLFGSRALRSPTLSLVVAAAMVLLGLPAQAAAVDYAAVTDHAPFSEAANEPEYWCEDGTRVEYFDATSLVLPAGEYAQVIVKGGSGEYANTVFGEPPTAGQTVWADTNGDGVFKTRGRDGDKDISHIIYCPAAANAAPVAVDDAYTLDEDSVLDVPAPGVLGNDTDPDGDTLTATALTDPAHGTLTLGTDGALVYTPAADYNGTDSFTYTACDPATACDTATVTLTITPVNDPPTADPDGPYTATAGVAVTFDGTGSTDGDGTIDSYQWDFGDTATGAGVSPSHVYADAGEYTVTLTVTDNEGATDTATTTATIDQAPNAPPVAEDDVYTLDEDAVLEENAPGVLGNDTDPDGDTLTAAAVTDPAHGTLTLGADGAVSYIPDPDYNGEDSFTYQACDPFTACDTATVTLTITPVNDPPTADPDGPYTATAGATVAFDGTGSYDIDGTIDSYLWDFGDTATGTGVSPSHTYAAAGEYTVTLTVTDNEGATDTATTTAAIDQAPNAPPVALDDAYTLDEDTTLDVNAPGVLGNDTDPEGDPLTAAVATDPAHGVLTLGADGALTYTPAADYNGEDSFTYTSCDPFTACDTATVTVSITPVNDPPTADAGSDQTATVGDQVGLDGTGSSDPVENDPLGYAWTLTSAPAGSAAALADPTTATPTLVPDLPGDYLVELTVDDGNGGSDTDTVTITAERIGMTLAVEDPLIAVGRSTTGTITLDHPAPVGGATITLALDTAVATVDPTDVTVPAGDTEAGFTVTGVAVGTTTLSGTSSVTGDATVEVGVTDQVISVDDIPVIAPEETADLPVSINKPAPPGGITLILTSLDPTIATVEPSVVIPEGQQVPATNPTVTGVDFGTTEIKATGLGYAPDTREVTVALTVTLTPDELDLPEGWTLPVTAQISAPAPAGGITLQISLDEPFADHPASTTIPAGQTLSAPIELTGLIQGTTTLRVGGPGLAEGTATVSVTDTPDAYLREFTSVSYPDRYLEPFVVGEDLQIQARVHLEAAPPEPVDVVVSAPVGSGLLFSPDPTTAGTPSLVVATGFTDAYSPFATPYFYVQGTIEGDDVDDDIPVTIDVVATGTTTPVGYEQADLPSAVDIGPSGFAFTTSNDLETTTFSPNEAIPVRAYLLYDTEGDPTDTGSRRYAQQVRGGYSTTVEVTSSNAIVGEMVAPATFPGGTSTEEAEFDPLAAGSTTLHVTPPAGFTAPADPNAYTTRTVVVDAPDLELQRPPYWSPSPAEAIGQNLQVERRIGLEVAPPAPGVDVTIEVADPTVAAISTDPTSAGGASITFPLVTGTYTPMVYIQGLSVGQGTELRVTAPGYDQWITTIETVPSGLFISLPSSDFTTTVGASNRIVRVSPASLDDLGRVDETQQLIGGMSASVEVTSSDPTVGAITVSPLVFTGGDSYLDTAFTPLDAGTTTIAVTQPPGFTAPATRTSVVATVEPE
jgi:PKD repeat protein